MRAMAVIGVVAGFGLLLQTTLFHALPFGFHPSPDILVIVCVFLGLHRHTVGGALGAFALALGGYITKLAADQVQPDTAITAIKASIGLVPATAAILAMLAFIAYPLTEKKYRDIVAENDTRKQKFLEQQNIATVPIPPVI